MTPRDKISPSCNEAALAIVDVHAVLGARECEMTPGDFCRITAFVRMHAGIVIGANREQMVYSRLIGRLRARGIGSFGQYVALLEQGDALERQEFINALTTNLTYFFREAEHFPILARHVADSRLTHAHRTVWCAACSTGEEAYSIAITLAERYNSFHPPVKVLATDIDTKVLRQAERGIYALEKIKGLTPQQVERFFAIDEHAGTVAVRPELRAMVTFRQVNLLDGAWAMRSPIDAIFCRNVMIYFDRPTQERILRKFAALMHPLGLLFVGHAESFTRCNELFNLCCNTVYELSEPGKALAEQSMSNWRAPSRQNLEGTYAASVP